MPTEAESAPPPDNYKLIYLIFLLHGIGVLMPWNMFITATGYFINYKLGKEYIGKELLYAENFLQFVGFASQVPNVIFNWINVFVQIEGSTTPRIVGSISIEIAIFIFTIILAMVDSSTWPGSFFWLTMLCIVILNIANAIYQNTLFGMVTKLPPKYTGGIILGNNICGTFTAIVRILADTFASNEKLSAIYFFLTALIVMLICIDSYFVLPLIRFYRYHEVKEKREARAMITQNVKETTPYFKIFKAAIQQLLNVFLIFFVTLSIFPAVQAKVIAVNPDFFITPKYYVSITCFLTFNMFAMIGSSLTLFWIWPHPKWLWVPSVLRFLYIPLFILSNYHNDPSDLKRRRMAVLIKNDWVYWIIAVTFALTHGYWSAIGMMYVPRTVEPRYAPTAGMFAAAVLITGIFIGVLSAFIWPRLIEL